MQHETRAATEVVLDVLATLNSALLLNASYQTI